MNGTIQSQCPMIAERFAYGLSVCQYRAGLLIASICLMESKILSGSTLTLSLSYLTCPSRF
jgi:hypothetical protein